MASPSQAFHNLAHARMSERIEFAANAVFAGAVEVSCGSMTEMTTFIRAIVSLLVALVAFVVSFVVIFVPMLFRDLH